MTTISKEIWFMNDTLLLKYIFSFYMDLYALNIEPSGQ